jgi:hypothetical protein
MRFSASGCRLVEYVDLGCFPDQRLENGWKIRMLVVRVAFVALQEGEELFLGDVIRLIGKEAWDGWDG